MAKYFALFNYLQFLNPLKLKDLTFLENKQHEYIKI